MLNLAQTKNKLLEFYHGNPLAEIAREYPIHLSDTPGKKVVIVATRGPEPGKPLSGGMAPAVIEACKDFDYKFWYAYGEDKDKDGKLIHRGAISRIAHAAFEAYHNKTVPVVAHAVEGIRVRKVKAAKDEWDGQYNEFCNRWVWPVCHNLLKFAKDVGRDDISYNWNANESLAKRIKQDLNGDSNTPIWIHDYHHMSLASGLRRNGVRNPIVYFHHIPLPTLETLKTDARERMHFVEMVKSLKACDAVVFQTEETTKRFYALIGEIAPESIPANTGHFIASDQNGRAEGKVFIATAPISINTEKVMRFAADPNLKTDVAKKLDEKLVAEYVFINFERCDYSKGILERVRAFEQLLEERPDLQGKAQLVLGAEPTRKGIPEYEKYAKDVEEVVSRLNAKFKSHGQDTVIFSNEPIANEDVIRLMRNRKEGQRRIGLVTPHEDGMNLTAKEFAAAQDLKNAGPLVLSSGAGTAAELDMDGKGAIVYPKFINGYVTPLVNAMKQAVDMPQAECNERAARMQEHLKVSNIQQWAGFFKDIFHKIQNGTFYPKNDNTPQPPVLAA